MISKKKAKSPSSLFFVFVVMFSCLYNRRLLGCRRCPWFEDESKVGEGSDTLQGNVRWLSTLKQLVLSSLTFHPSAKLRIGRVLGGDIAMSIHLLVLGKLSQSFGPCRSMAIPCDANILQCRNPLLA